MTSGRQLGKYKLVATLGQGGMADVYLAVSGGPVAGFSKLAVVKKVRAHLAEDAEFIAMMLEEARVSARLNHPNVVQVHDVDVVDGEYFLAMEFLDGQPLHRLLHRAAKTKTSISADARYLVLADMLRGLHYAHDLADYDGAPLNIVHRDVNPQNVFVMYTGSVKLVDFGIAKAEGRKNETKQGFVRGKIRYMSPEQVRGRRIDRRTDIFAAGVMLWQAATGKRFWGARDDESIVNALVSSTYNASPRRIAPDVPETIDAICRKALAPDASDRYATAAEMLSDLETFLGDREVEARRALVAAITQLFVKERLSLRSVLETEAGPMAMTSSLGAMLVPAAAAQEVVDVPAEPLRADPPRRRSLVPAFVGASVVCAVLAAGLVVATRGGHAPRLAATVTKERTAFESSTRGTVLFVRPQPAAAESESEREPRGDAASRRKHTPPRIFVRAPPRRPASSKTSSSSSVLGLDTTDPWH